MSEEIEKDVIGLIMSLGKVENSWVLVRNRISDLKTLHSNALPLSYKDSMVSKVITKFIHDTHPVYCEDQQCPLKKRLLKLHKKQFSFYWFIVVILIVPSHCFHSGLVLQTRVAAYQDYTPRGLDNFLLFYCSHLRKGS